MNEKSNFLRIIEVSFAIGILIKVAGIFFDWPPLLRWTTEVMVLPKVIILVMEMLRSDPTRGAFTDLNKQTHYFQSKLKWAWIFRKDTFGSTAEVLSPMLFLILLSSLSMPRVPEYVLLFASGLYTFLLIYRSLRYLFTQNPYQVYLNETGLQYIYRGLQTVSWEEIGSVSFEKTEFTIYSGDEKLTFHSDLLKQNQAQFEQVFQAQLAEREIVYTSYKTNKRVSTPS